MSNSGETEVARFIANAKKLEEAHAYSPEQEHDACGMFVSVIRRCRAARNGTWVESFTFPKL